MALALVLVHLFPSPIARLFVTEERAVGTAVYFLEVWTYTIVFIGALELFNAIFQAFGKWKISLANIIIDKGCLLTPVLILLVRWRGIEGIAYSQIITEGITAIALTAVYLRIARNMGRDRPKGTD